MDMRTRVKICGITNPTDARLAAAAGADAIGLVFHEASPRHVTPDAACDIFAVLPPFVTAYAVVLEPDDDALYEVGSMMSYLSGIQFHGREDPIRCEELAVPYIKAVPMNEPGALAAYQERYELADGFLLDSHAPGEAGGRGETFDWARVETDDPRPLILAGGLNPGNVAAAIRAVRPWGVDVSSGVEAAPGRKDPAKLEAFMREVRRASS